MRAEFSSAGEHVGPFLPFFPRYRWVVRKKLERPLLAILPELGVRVPGGCPAQVNALVDSEPLCRRNFEVDHCRVEYVVRNTLRRRLVPIEVVVDDGGPNV